jgi:hypothetical protein
MSLNYLVQGHAVASQENLAILIAAQEIGKSHM